jgi:hypothetical protein
MARRWPVMAYEETGLGRYEDKILKNQLVTEKTPGTEDLRPQAITGDDGLSLTEPAPLRRHRRDHADDQPDLDDHQQYDRDARGGQCGGFQRASEREAVLLP